MIARVPCHRDRIAPLATNRSSRATNRCGVASVRDPRRSSQPDVGTEDLETEEF
jgi:hypothetical protein